ncbi:hypothetical protein [Mesorhizobium sp. Mes31]|uniref:hypothetical protein n=1 Tax=Mesorhizobium sp. Mes31 TaxID=2926017 RepID=UPI002117CDDB|nr:hypothetical protein [Mesorhizobium sp. Mes31]
MTPFEKWYIPLLFVQILISIAIFVVTALAVNTWWKQINYGKERQVSDKLWMLCDRCALLFSEARDREFFLRLDTKVAGFESINGEEKILFWALYSPYHTLNTGFHVFDELDTTSIEAKHVLGVDVMNNVSELKKLRNQIMNSSIRIVDLKFGPSPTSEEKIEELEIEVHESILFSSKNDKINIDISKNIESIRGSLLARKVMNP